MHMTLPIDPHFSFFMARLLLVLMFPFSALEKVFFKKEALAQADSTGFPQPVGITLLALGGILEFVAPFCIVFGWYARPAAWLLAGFCGLTALLYKPFWKPGDLMAPVNSQGRGLFWDFLKNFALAGGLALIGLGVGFPPDGAGPGTSLF